MNLDCGYLKERYFKSKKERDFPCYCLLCYKDGWFEVYESILTYALKSALSLQVKATE